MEKEFIRSLINGVINENLVLYKEIIDTPIAEVTDEYWKNVISLYNSVDRSRQETIVDIFKQVMIDTVSTMLGIIDGSIAIDDYENELELRINDQKTDDCLQDIFLELTEEE